MKRWLRHVPSGELYEYDPVFAARADFEPYDPNPAPAPVAEEEPVVKKPAKRTKKAAIPEDLADLLGE